MSILGPRLRQRITLEQPVQVRDAVSGAYVTTWTAFASDEPAEVVPLSGKEFLQSQSLQAQVDTRATIRWRPGVTAQMRALHDGSIYAITAVLPDPSARRWLTLLLSRGVNDGG